MILCLSSFFKGNDFLDQCKREGAHVVLLTVENILQKPWVRESIDEVYALPSFNDRRAVVNTVSYLSRTRNFTRLAPLDDYDVELVAHLREHLRIPGMGETTARYFRDKLAMRARCRDRGILVPSFVHVLNHDLIAEFLRTVPPPWLLKPRSEASSLGIKKFMNADDVWKTIHELGDLQSNYLIEKMIPGDVFHVDSIVSEGEVVFAECHGYKKPLFDLVNQGGIFATRTLPRGGEIERDLLETHGRVVHHLGLKRGVTHTEYIRGKEDGKIYFLETAARVGGVHIADLAEASTGINLWREWAKIELLQGEGEYKLPERKHGYAGLVISLARQETPDMSGYNAPEVVWHLKGNPFHAGLIFTADDVPTMESRLDHYMERIDRDFGAVLPPATTATH
ncbi:MAG: ATP-grasp domain-containing protein [Polyangiaceae bacterium]|nr:ATP-grasp domain-containing protein [Polyangiaceae bacterium]